MTVEADIFLALKDLVPTNVDGRRGVWRDIAPTGVMRPYITFQQVGGVAVNLLESAVADKKNGRFQINAWADGRDEVASLSRQIEDTLVASLRATVIGAPVAVYEEETKLYGTRQDFSIWF